MTHPACAVILAAGQGQRLSGTLPDRPKGFLELAGGPIIERSIRQLRAVGIADIVIVAGYSAHYYEALARRDPDIHLAYNDRYAETGSLTSLHCARTHVSETFLLLESDLVYETRALHELLACPHPNAILMSGFTRSGDEVFIETQGAYVRKLSKNSAELANLAGELVGVAKVSPAMFDAMMRFADSQLPHRPRLHYEDGINAVAGEIAVFHHRVEDLIWAEIDTPDHLRRVVEQIAPKLDPTPCPSPSRRNSHPSSFILHPSSFGEGTGEGEEAVMSFVRDGFLIVEGLFNRSEIARMDRAIRRLARKPPEDCVGRQMVYFEDTVYPDGGRTLSRIEKFIEYSPLLKQVTDDPRILSLLGRMMNDDPVLFKEKINFKMPGGQAFEPHQDMQAGWDAYADYFISALVAIDPSTEENGCIELAAGQHTRGLIGEKWAPLRDHQLEGLDFVKYATAPGDVVFFDGCVPHRSAPNRTGRPRRNLYLTYNRKSAGDHRLRYYADKRLSFPPDYEREPGKAYKYKV